MAPHCDHKFIDSKNCLKCGISFAELRARQIVELENCPARLARFGLELADTAPDDRTAGMLANVPLPCVESAERPGRCIHCQQPTLQSAGAPHGPFCTSIDAGCRECRRLQREAASSASAAPAAAPAPIESDDQPDAETLEAWRADADRWAREHSTGFSAVATRRLATLIHALTETRAERDRVKSLAGDALRRLGTVNRQTGELAKRVDTLTESLSELQRQVLGRWGQIGREPFSSTPVEITPNAVDRAESDFRRTYEAPPHAPQCQCPICTH